MNVLSAKLAEKSEKETPVVRAPLRTGVRHQGAFSTRPDMGEMRTNIVFYWTLHITYGENENFLKLTHIHITTESKMHTLCC